MTPLIPESFAAETVRKKEKFAQLVEYYGPIVRRNVVGDWLVSPLRRRTRKPDLTRAVCPHCQHPVGSPTCQSGQAPAAQ